MVFFLFILLLYNAQFISPALLCLQQKPRKRLKRHLLAETESATRSARLLFLMQIFFMYSFPKMKSNHFVFASNFEIIQSNLDKKLLMLHVCSIFDLVHE